MPELATMPESDLGPSLLDERAGRYLIFRLGHGEFGVPIHKLREVMEMQHITRVPDAPVFIAGVMNLRGKVIPVIDLRLTFGLPLEPHTSETCLIIVRAALASIDQVLAIVVDAVSEVIYLQGPEILFPEEVQPFSEFGTRDPAPYLLGVARCKGNAKLLLDLDEVLNNLDPRQAPGLSAAA